MPSRVRPVNLKLGSTNFFCILPGTALLSMVNQCVTNQMTREVPGAFRTLRDVLLAGKR